MSTAICPDEQTQTSGKRQSPVALMSVNPSYERLTRPLVTEYPATMDNLRLKNTGFSWEVKIPYHLSLNTALHGAHLANNQYFRLDQFHCHWGANNEEGSEHTIDGRTHSAELHFVHYNMERYHTMARAARHPDGLVVLSVFLSASQDHHNHAELEKIVAQLKAVSLKGELTFIKQPLRLDNLLPANRSYWSYSGSLTTAPFLESVTWFVFKHPIRCSASQLNKFRTLRSSARGSDDEEEDCCRAGQTGRRDQAANWPPGGSHISANRRDTQPLNGRTISTYDEMLHH